MTDLSALPKTLTRDQVETLTRSAMYEHDFDSLMELNRRHPRMTISAMNKVLAEMTPKPSRTRKKK